MKRAYDVKIERGNFDAWEYVVVAATDEEAVRKAKRQAREDSGCKGGWRLVRLSERSERVIA